jgi:hypothetical protein
LTAAARKAAAKTDISGVSRDDEAAAPRGQSKEAAASTGTTL